ncbi:MAG: hypothetical protein GY809_27910, partial [Planctomycetes bacterium]|nr:hypothetical protein [Planctomycetota bacterium]
ESEPQPNTACTPAPRDMPEQAGDRTQPDAGGPDPGHGEPPPTRADRHATGPQATDFSEADTTHHAHPEHHASLAGVDASATVPVTTLDSGRTEAKSQPEAGLPVTRSAAPQIQKTSIASAAPTHITETRTSQVSGRRGSPPGGRQAVYPKDRNTFPPENAESSPDATERMTLPANAASNDNASASAGHREDPRSAAHLPERTSTNSPSHGGLADRAETSTAPPVEIRINTLSFEIRHDPATKPEPPRLNDRIETQRPSRTAPHGKLQTPAHRLSRHYLRGY